MLQPRTAFVPQECGRVVPLKLEMVARVNIVSLPDMAIIQTGAKLSVNMVELLEGCYDDLLRDLEGHRLLREGSRIVKIHRDFDLLQVEDASGERYLQLNFTSGSW
jgi:hypothetical protein